MWDKLHVYVTLNERGARLNVKQKELQQVQAAWDCVQNEVLLFMSWTEHAML